MQEGPLAKNVYILLEAMILSGLPRGNTNLEDWRWGSGLDREVWDGVMGNIFVIFQSIYSEERENISNRPKLCKKINLTNIHRRVLHSNLGSERPRTLLFSVQSLCVQCAGFQEKTGHLILEECESKSINRVKYSGGEV